MAKFNLSITAHVGNDAMIIYSKDYDYSRTNSIRVLDMLKGLVACADWQPDDGEDQSGTAYCQYVSYWNGKPCANYLLGAWTELDENGCMKV